MVNDPVVNKLRKFFRCLLHQGFDFRSHLAIIGYGSQPIEFMTNQGPRPAHKIQKVRMLYSIF